MGMFKIDQPRAIVKQIWLELENQRTGPWPTRVYEDLRPIATNRPNGAGAPDMAVLTGDFYVPAFDAGTVERQTFIYHLPHNYAKDTNPSFHIHTTHNIGSPTGTQVRWNTKWYFARGYGVDAFSEYGETQIAALQTVGGQFVHEIFGEDGENPANDKFVCPPGIAEFLEPDSIVAVTLERDATHVDDDFAHDIFVLTADLHILVERDGTTERNRPFTSGGW